MTTGRINQVTASVFAGPEGPHRRASAFHGTTPCILRDSRLLARPEAASNCSSLRVRFAPNRASTSSLIVRLPPARADSADVRDNLVIDRANSALVRL